jgi:hypothetical protein
VYELDNNTGGNWELEVFDVKPKYVNIEERWESG